MVPVPVEQGGRVRLNIISKYYFYYCFLEPLDISKGFTGIGSGHSLVEPARGSTWHFNPSRLRDLPVKCDVSQRYENN